MNFNKWNIGWKYGVVNLLPMVCFLFPKSIPMGDGSGAPAHKGEPFSKKKSISTDTIYISKASLVYMGPLMKKSRKNSK